MKKIVCHTKSRFGKLFAIVKKKLIIYSLLNEKIVYNNSKTFRNDEEQRYV